MYKPAHAHAHAHTHTHTHTHTLYNAHYTMHNERQAQVHNVRAQLKEVFHINMMSNVVFLVDIPWAFA